MPDIINIIKKHKGEKTHQKVAKNKKAPYRRLHTPLTYSELIKNIVNPWGGFFLYPIIIIYPLTI